MATAKRDLTDPKVQGPHPTKDPLDRLVAIAIQVAVREGLLSGPGNDVGTEELATEKAAVNRRSA